MMTTKPTIVLIHGAWHAPKTYSKLTSALESAGYEVYIPRLPSLSETRPPPADLATDTALVRSYVENLIDSGRTVIALMHSYGGQVGSNALHGLGLESRSKAGLQGGVSNLIYLCAYALPEGKSMVDKVKEFGMEDVLPLVFDFADDRSGVPRDPKTMFVGAGADEAEAEEYVSTLVRWNGKCMYQEATHAAWREIPVTYVHTLQDVTVPLNFQTSMVEGMRAQGREVKTVELDTGHCPNLTKTKDVVDIVNQVVAGQAPS